MEENKIPTQKAERRQKRSIRRIFLTSEDKNVKSNPILNEIEKNIVKRIGEAVVRKLQGSSESIRDYQLIYYTDKMTYQISYVVNYSGGNSYEEILTDEEMIQSMLVKLLDSLDRNTIISRLEELCLVINHNVGVILPHIHNLLPEKKHKL